MSGQGLRQVHQQPQHDDRFAAVRAALRRDNPAWQIQHIDITCDGCETEPIIGQRFKCTVCEDIDLCGACMRALVAARIKMAAEDGLRSAPPRQGQRPRRWVHKLHSRDSAEKWAALQTAVPCLHPSHKFQRVLDGPERAVVFLAGRHQQQQRQQQQQQQTAVEAATDADTPGVSSGGRSSSGGSAALEEFLATFKPSAASCRDVAWIVVSHDDGDQEEQQPCPAEQQQTGQQQRQGAQQEQEQPARWQRNARTTGSASGSTTGTSAGLEDRVDAAVEEWEKLVEASAARGAKPTAADVDALAAKHAILKGKWMLFARNPAEADAAWAAVARAVCGGSPTRAPPLCSSAKVSSTGPPPDASWVLCVYTANYQDSADVQRVCRGLQAAVPCGTLQQDRRMLFKPDIYTFLGIYSRNEWGLKPSILEARLPEQQLAAPQRKQAHPASAAERRPDRRSCRWPSSEC